MVEASASVGVNGLPQEAEHAGLHHRRPGTLDVDQTSSAATVDVEAAVNHTPDSPGKDTTEQQEEVYAEVSYLDIFKQFSLLGWTAFGGPAAHIGMFQRVSLAQDSAATQSCSTLMTINYCSARVFQRRGAIVIYNHNCHPSVAAPALDCKHTVSYLPAPG